MTLTELRYIVTLAEEGHFGRAAVRCHVSQPTLSIAVKKLEDELGLALFERSKLRVSATALGEQIVAKARGILQQTADIRDLADTGKDQLQGPLKLGALNSVGPYLLPQLIPLMQELASNMPLYIDEGQHDSLTKRLRNGDLDTILVTQPFNEADLVCQSLFSETLVALVPVKHQLAARDRLHITDLEPEESLIPGEGLCLRQQIFDAFPHLAEADSATVRFQSNSLEALRYMVAAGLGVAVLPLMVAEHALHARDAVVIKQFRDPAPRRELALAWRLSFPRHKAIDILRRALLACSGAHWKFCDQPVQEAPGLIVDNRLW